MPTLAQLAQFKRCRVCREYKYTHGHSDCGACRKRINLKRKEIYQTQGWRMMLLLADGVCPKCHQHTQLTIDHIIPLSVEWNWELQNLQPICHPCNIKKGYRTEDYRPKEWLYIIERTIKENP